MLKEVASLFLLYRFGPLVLFPMLFVAAFVILLLLNPLTWIVIGLLIMVRAVGIEPTSGQSIAPEGGDVISEGGATRRLEDAVPHS